MKLLHSTSCGDWHRSWGFSHSRIGKLYATDLPDTYVWKGQCQDRYGSVWGRGQEVTYNAATGDIIPRNDNSRLPDLREVHAAIVTLKNKTK